MIREDLDDLIGNPPQQIAVMRNEKHRSGELGERVLKNLLASEVKVVGRFVQHQEVSPLRHQNREGEFCPFAARKDTDFFVDVLADQQHPSKLGSDLGLGFSGITLPKLFNYGIFGV